MLFYDAVKRLKVSMNFLLQDFGYDPDRKDCKPPSMSVSRELI